MEARISIIMLASVLFVSSSEQKTLQQVLILSRHNVRTPLSKILAETTPKPWPQWKQKSGYLTAKGSLLEGFMGEYFSSWLYSEGLLPEYCPNNKEVFVYANVKQRTMASAKAFVSKAFPNCNIPIHFNKTAQDPIFNPVIHNTTEQFKLEALEQMQQILKSLHLNSSYDMLNDILDYKNSEFCKVEMKCDLIGDKNKIIDVIPGSKPNVDGPLKIGNSVIDAFIMENYEGLQNVAWGSLSNKTKWDTVMKLSRGYHNVIFNSTLIAQDIADPLIKYMAGLIKTTKLKMVLLMGHDANIYSVLNSLNFKPYFLDGQHEKTPVGGKIVFQKWNDEIMKRDYLRIEYVYQSTMQMRKGERLSLNNPPKSTLLELHDCKADIDGFCSWDDFVKLLERF